ncbi:MAG: hypothetical protein CMJ75_02880, partial [Planctomycetaceae bacterium]|nr:hypothetical protein [Planctomycetaceae bacterium]
YFVFDFNDKVLNFHFSGKVEIQYFVIEIKDKVMNFHFSGNAETGKGDLNAMYSAIEVISTLLVDPQKKLTSQWSKIKGHRI